MQEDQSPIKIAESPTSKAEEAETFKVPDERRRHLQNKELEDQIGFKRDFAKKSGWVAGIWIGFLIALTAGQFSLKKWGFGLTEYEYIAVIGSASAPILAFWLVVGRNLFPKAPPR